MKGRQTLHGWVGGAIASSMLSLGAGSAVAQTTSAPPAPSRAAPAAPSAPAAPAPPSAAAPPPPVPSGSAVPRAAPPTLAPPPSGSAPPPQPAAPRADHGEHGGSQAWHHAPDEHEGGWHGEHGAPYWRGGYGYGWGGYVGGYPYAYTDPWSYPPLVESYPPSYDTNQDVYPYYCPSEDAYYPDVTYCPGGWTVEANPSGP